ncbi:hypothetical protein EB796_009670 [Bugula neritina]|uniref:Fibrillar collagen NC1 domain-containing protein n=1 Tax=Bugula neritina TaxID=10212 RepID=A0A7J7K350_BUGNE|nr:hypothetical protein EB796_009674 [Bugula neritina]KAF6032029.1 hypothetical protein EB796_009670 [Bugula neritina]
MSSTQTYFDFCASLEFALCHFIDTKTTTHLPIIDIAPGDIWTTHKELGVQLGEVSIHRLIPNNSFIWLICKTVPDLIISGQSENAINVWLAETRSLIFI